MKTFTAAQLAELQKLRGARRAFFIEADFAASGFTRMWTGAPDISWNSVVWAGVGQVLSIGGITASVNGRANAVEFVFAPKGRAGQNNIVGPFLNNRYVNRQIKVWRGFVSDAGTVIASPDLVIWGRLSAPKIEDDRPRGQRRFMVQSAGEAESQSRSQQFRISQAMQQQRDPSDKGLSMMAFIPGREEKWIKG